MKTKVYVPDNVLLGMLSTYILALAGAESVGMMWGSTWGALAHAILIPVMLTHSAVTSKRATARVLLALALVSLLRLLSLAMLIPGTSPIYWFVPISLPLLLGVALAVRSLNLSSADLGVRLEAWELQALIGFSGVPLSLAAYLLLRPSSFLSRANVLELAFAVLSLAIFGGFTEELLFRGLLQTVATEALGVAGGIIVSSSVYAVVCMSWLSLWAVGFALVVGLFFGWCVNRTRSIWGVAAAHSLLNVGAFLIWPFIWR